VTMQPGDQPPTIEQRVTDLEAGALDLPCPKCGCTDVRIRYCDGCQLRHYRSNTLADDQCRDGDPEHFHRTCARCTYAWRTDDAINARVMCPETRTSAEPANTTLEES
jgi:hypothetical protein